MTDDADTPGERVADLEAELERTEQQLAAVRERYERLVDDRARLRRETPEDDEFVWTGAASPSRSRTGGRSPAGGDGRTPAAVESTGGERLPRADGGAAWEAPDPGPLGRVFEWLMG